MGLSCFVLVDSFFNGFNFSKQPNESIFEIM